MAEYFELSWAILSTIGIFNTLVGVMVVGIVGFSMVSLVPLIVSVAMAVANGLCYYAFYTDHPVANIAAASVSADLFWLVQEAGLSFYSYAILVRVLTDLQRRIFLVVFWVLMTVIGALRMGILSVRLRYILKDPDDTSQQLLIDHLHIGYFSCIATVECLSAVFLLQTFNSARRVSKRAAIKGGLFSYLMRSTEIRLASLALVGLTRATTYSFQTRAQSAEGVAGQLDRFAYTLECLFPVVMFIDILASRLIFANKGRSHATMSTGESLQATMSRRLSDALGVTGTGHVEMHTPSQSGRLSDTIDDRKSCDAVSSREPMIDRFGATSHIEAGVGVADGSDDDGRSTPGISKTV